MWACRPPTPEWTVLPLGFVAPTDTGFPLVANEVDWDVAWPETVPSDGPPSETGAAFDSLSTGETGFLTGDTGIVPRRAPSPRDTSDTGEELEPETAFTGVTGITGITGATGFTGETADTGPPGPGESIESSDSTPTGDTAPPPAPVLVNPADLVVPDDAPRYSDPLDLVVPQRTPETPEE